MLTFLPRLSLAISAAWTRFLRRPDLWVGAFALAVVAFILVATPVSLRGAQSIAYDHLAASFGAGFVSVVLGLFTAMLLRAAPARPRLVLRLAWLAAIALSTAGLLAAYAPPDPAAASAWLLQALVLSTLAHSTLVVGVLFGGGLVTARDLRRTATDITRHWGLIFLYLLLAGYLLTAVRLAHPAVIDPVLLRMDVSLGFNASELIRPWVLAHPWIGVATDYGYPLLGLFLALTAAGLHLAGAIAALRRCIFAYLLVAFLGITAYWFAPAIGPIFAYPELVAGPAQHSGGPPAFDALRHEILTGPDRPVLSPAVPRNVFPSLHVAFALVALTAAWCHRRRWFWWLLPLGGIQIITTLTLGVHYVVDLVAAVPFTALCWTLADAALRRFPPTAAAPLPPLRVTGPARVKLALAFALALVTALAALVLWGRFAPLPPVVAWPLVALITALPTWLALRLHATAPSLRPARSPVNFQPETSPSPAGAPRLLAFAVFCTGGTALLLEQISEKYLSTLLGVSRPAATIVLAVYFAGLALGAWLCPKKTPGAPRRLALLELFIAAWAGLLATAFFATDRALGEWLAATGTSAPALTAARLALALLWLLPPTLAMGAQLPTLAAVLAGQPAAPDRTLPRFYALNLAGACVFTLAAPPLLFSPFGANGTLWFVAALALFVGLALWSALPASPSSLPSSPSSLPFSPFTLRPSLFFAFAAGFVFFALEVTWFHLISAVCGASTYSFSILLAAVLLALALAGRHIARSASTALALPLGALVLTLALSNAAWPWAGRVLATLRAALALESFWAGELLKLTVVSALVIPPAFFLGQIFPRLLRAVTNVPDPARATGHLCAANVLGCVAGALVTGFALIPTLGAEHTLRLLAALLLLTTCLLCLRPLLSGFRVFRVVRGPPLPSALVLPVAALVLLIFLPRWDRLELTRGFGVYLAPQLPPAAQLVSFHEDFRAGFVTVVATPSTDPARTAPVLTLLQNGKFEADDADEIPAQVSFGLIAALHAPAPDRALVIGCGSGQTASVIARLGFAQVDLAELSPAHLAAAREHFGHLNHDVFDRPGVTVHIEDGRQLLLRTRDHYDLIQIELTSIWFAGATNLYSREFYALARERLAPGGVLVQWVQLHHLTPREIATMIATARAEFPGVSLWRAGTQACLIGFTAQPQLNPAVWRAWRTSPELATERAHPDLAGLDSAAAFLRGQLLSTTQVNALLNRYAGRIGQNTDRNRWLEFQTPKYYLSPRDHVADNLRWLTAAP